MCVRRASFMPVRSSEPDDIVMATFSLDSRDRFSASIWVWAALVLLLLSNVLFLTAFVTNHWGVVRVESNATWYVGLWQSCSYDPSFNMCIGPGWPPFYSAARSFMVMALFGHVLLFAWLIGYTLEKLLDYDPCTMGCLVALAFSTAIFVIIAICCFGILWPSYSRVEFPRAKTEIGYSLWLAMTTIFFLIASGVLCIIEIRTSLLRLEAQTFAGAEGIFFTPEHKFRRPTASEECIIDEDVNDM